MGSVILTRGGFFPIGQERKYLDYADLVYAEAANTHCRVYMKGLPNPITVRRLLRQLESLLPGDQFFRIHKKFVVNSRYFDRVARDAGGGTNLYLTIDGIHLPVGRRYRLNIGL